MSRFNLNDVVIRKGRRYDKGCVVLEISSVRNGGGWITKYQILDYDRRPTAYNGRYVKEWVDESELELHKMVMRDKKLNELGI